MELSDEILFTLYCGELEVKKLRQSAIDDITGIDYIKEPVSYESFFLQYLLPNRPCILGPWSTENWLSRKEWVTNENKPNWQLMKGKFGNAQCPVADCKQTRYDSHPKTDMSLSEFIDYVECYAAKGYPAHEDCLYLKDWHFQRAFPKYEAYCVPDYFLSDWMNEFWDRRDDVCDDYRFVYIGPKGSWTPFHTDVFKSYSWSANICGRKKWIMFPPGAEEHLKDKLGHLPFDVNSDDLADIDKYPFTSKATKRFEIYQEAGEIIFVPSGWYHQVTNVEDTISINHNWSNGCNIDLCWHYLMTSMSAVQQEISDCRDMEGWAEQCQLILRANNGMDYDEFYRFLYTVANCRINTLHEHKTGDQTKQCCQGNPESQHQDHPESQHQDHPESQHQDHPESWHQDHPESRHQDHPESRHQDHPESWHQDHPESRHQDHPESQHQDHPKSQHQDHPESQHQDHPESQHQDHPESRHQEHPQSQHQDCSQSYLNQLVFDLLEIKNVVFTMKRNKEFLQLDFEQFTVRPKALMKSIEDATDDYMSKLN